MGLIFRRGHELVREELNITRFISAARTSHVMKSHLSDLSSEHKRELERAPIRHITLQSGPPAIWTADPVITERESKPLLDETSNVSINKGPAIDLKEEVVIPILDNFDQEDPARVIEQARAQDEKIRYDRTRMTVDEKGKLTSA